MLHRIDSYPSRGPLLALATIALLAAGQASAGQLLFENRLDRYAITADAIKAGGAVPVDREIADDFVATGVLQRVIVSGYDCFNCVGALATGVNVRLYESAPGGMPGSLLYEFHYAADDARFVHDPNRSGHEDVLDITFPQGYAVDGRYFISAQLEYPAAATWPLRSANSGAPEGSAYVERDRLTGSAWTHGTSGVFPNGNHDLTFALYGVRPGPPPPRLVAGCGEWSVDDAPLPAGAENAQLRAVKAFSPDDIWAVGDYDATVGGNTQSWSLAMHYTNGAWSIVPTPSPSACPTCAQVFVSAIDGVAPNDLWASGWKRALDQQGFLGGEPFTMHYDGYGWSEVATLVTSGSTGAWARGIKALAPNEVWFVGDWTGQSPWGFFGQPALAMRWGGSAFTQFETPFPPAGTPGWSFDALSGRRNDLWAVGGGSDGDDASATYFAHWNGTDWQLSQPSMPGILKRFSHVLSLTPTLAFAGGEGFSVEAGYFPLVARYDGTAWTPTDTGGGGGGPMVSFGPETVLALSTKSAYFNGSTWVAQPELPDVLGTLRGIAATGPCDATAVGVQFVASVKRPLIARIRPIVFDSGFE